MIPHHPLTIGITGSIGSGKSVVCRLFNMLGVPVYDSDSKARLLMNSDPVLIDSLIRRFGQECFRNGVLNRKLLAERVFGDAAALADLNALVHPAVTRDFLTWTEAFDTPYVIVESAILFESGLNRVVDRTVAVTAPVQLRLHRAAMRDNTSQDNIRARMKHQMNDETLAASSDFVIVNDDKSLVWPQVLSLNTRFRHLYDVCAGTAEKL